MCLSGCVWQPSFSGFHSFWIHCAARKQEGPFPQMVSTDEQLNLDMVLTWMVDCSSIILTFKRKVTACAYVSGHMRARLCGCMRMKLLHFQIIFSGIYTVLLCTIGNTNMHPSCVNSLYKVECQQTQQAA